MAKIYLADSQDYVVATSFDEATDKFISERGKDPQTMSLFKDENLVITASNVVEVKTSVAPEAAKTDGALASPSVSYIKEGNKVTLTATPSTNYTTFVGWSVGGSQVSTSNPYTYTAPNSAVEVVATFSS